MTQDSELRIVTCIDDIAIVLLEDRVVNKIFNWLYI